MNTRELEVSESLLWCVQQQVQDKYSNRIRLRYQQKWLCYEPVSGVSGYLKVLLSFSYFTPVHFGQRKMSNARIKPQQFKQRQILKIIKGHFEDDSVWFLSKRNIFILAPVAIGLSQLNAGVLSPFANDIFSPLKIHFNDS